jgi:hypothetical protein
MSTLNKSPFFQAMFRGASNSEQVIPFIDRDPDAFKHILSLLRDPTFPFPKGLEHELQFYGISRTTKKSKGKKYMLLSDFVKMSPEAQLGHTEPVQVVPMKKALVGGSIRRENGNLRVACVLTLESWNNLHACGIVKAPKKEEIGKSVFLFTIESDTVIYFQEATGHVSKIQKDALWMKYSPNSFLVVPVLKDAKKEECVVIYFTPHHPLDQFQ